MQETSAVVSVITSDETIPIVIQPAVSPLAILQAGEYPLWFQFTDNGPILIETIEDACFSAAFIPWPLALHVRFTLAHDNNVHMALNGDGFISVAPWGHGEDGAARVGLYRFSGGEFWRQYTVAAFALLDEKPAALLYRDDRFLDSGAPLPSPRLWTFDLSSAGPQALDLPALDTFAPQDNWDIDTLRRGADGYWHYRAVKKAAQPEIRMFRSEDLIQAGEQIPLGTFQNAALPEPVSAAPVPLREMLSGAFAISGSGIAAVVSPEFKSTRHFAVDREKNTLLGFYANESSTGNAFFVAIQAQGTGVYIDTSSSTHEIALPPLPQGFVYTGIGMVTDTIIATWEEQEGYSIGAAGFTVIRLTVPRD